MAMNSEFFDLVLEGGAMWVKSQISKSEMHPVAKTALHIAIDAGKVVCSDVYHRLKTQWAREHIIALARVCDVERVELISLGTNCGDVVLLALGGDVKLFFQCLNLPFVLLKDNPTLAQKIDVARKYNSTVIYQKT